jgi:exonuclease SbcD
MKILHTSDWHIGRTFHTHSTLAHLTEVLAALVTVVREHDVQVVAVAGDIFDSAMPSKDSFGVLAQVLRELKNAGAIVVMTSGNHDSAARLGFQSEWASLAGIHVITGHDQYLEPVTVIDEHGPVHFYGIPFLEPVLVRHHYPHITLKTHEQVLTFVMQQIRADLAVRGGRSVVLSHCFAAGIATGVLDGEPSLNEEMPVERDITAGGLDIVPVSVFDGPDYVALGHIHGRATLSPRVRYCGAPLHYSFGEADKPRGAWLVEFDASGLADTVWIDLPVPRRLSVLTGVLDDLLTDVRYAGNEGDWVKAILTDQVRPLDAMRTLQGRFSHCVALEHRPAIVVETDAVSYSQRIRAKTDQEIVAGFLEYVRNGVGPNDFEDELITEVLAETNRAQADA